MNSPAPGGGVSAVAGSKRGRPKGRGIYPPSLKANEDELRRTHEVPPPSRGIFFGTDNCRMLESLKTLSLWLQSWATPEMGLWGLFGSAFLSATVLPGSSEIVLTALIAAYPEQAWTGFFVALAGNLLGCLLTFGMGYAGRQGYERFRHVRVQLDGVHAQRLQRWGPPALVLSVLPLVGDALVLAAGWLRLPLASSLAWIALGKAIRYLLVVLAMQGLLSLA